MAQQSSNPDDLARVALRPGARLGAVVSTYHGEICDAMLASARRELERAGLASGNLVEIRAPGAFEIPLIARRLAVRDDIDAVLCFGLVLQGETTHAAHLATAAAQGIQGAALQTDKPILFGILTCATLEQARARALATESGGEFDKGRETARAAILALAALEQAAKSGRLERSAGFFHRGSEGAPQ